MNKIFIFFYFTFIVLLFIIILLANETPSVARVFAIPPIIYGIYCIFAEIKENGSDKTKI